jgi:tetratricopeptide (TPR) repeat protein
MRMGENGAALQSYREALSIDPNRRDAWINSGLILLDSGMDTEAEVIFRKFRERSPSDALGLFHHARSLERLGRREEATRAFRDFLQIYEGEDVSLRTHALERIRKLTVE